MKTQASAQRDMLSLRETSGDMLCLSSPGSPTRRSYRAVLEVSPINLALKAEDEQAAIIERFGALIRSLSYPLQVLVRTVTLDSTTLATMFPFLSNSIVMPDGMLVGISETHEPVLLNPWDNSLENPHLFIGGGTGPGKSHPGQIVAGRDLLF